MVEIDDYHPEQAAAAMEDDEAERMRSGVFEQLKPYCLDLLELLQNPKKHSSAVPSLLQFLRQSPPEALQPFFDYTLFPLLLLLDAAVACRSTEKVDSGRRVEISNNPKLPHKVSDAVAEGVLQCLEELLIKCHLGSIEQMVVVLKKLTYGALLTPSNASEEFREGIVKCFQALLLSLLPCSDESCTCKRTFSLPILLESRDLKAMSIRSAKCNSEQGECLLAFLRSQTSSAAVGHWLSLLLRVADTEAALGHRGSAKLRFESFMTLRVLVAKVGTADALAFFLPGVVSQFAKVLHASKAMASGAAGSVEAVDQALRGLAEFLMIVLQDDANMSSLDDSIDITARFISSKSLSTVSFMEELRNLPVKAHGQSAFVVDSSGQMVKMITPEPEMNEQRIDSGKGIGSFHVTRTKDWIEKTSAHVDKLLGATFPNVCVHPAKRVRQGLLAAIQGLLSKCSCTLKKSRLMLLECLCALVVDDCEEVSAVAQEFLENSFSSTGRSFLEDDVAEIFSRLIDRLPKVVLGNEESLAILQAQQLLVIIYYSGPQFLVDRLLQSPVTAARFLEVFSLCLSQNSVFAGSLDKLVRTSSVGYLDSVAELKGGINLIGDRLTIMSAAPKISESAPSQDKQVTYPEEKTQKNFELPRMPPWFIHVGSPKLYQALAGILRLVGSCLMADLRGGLHLLLITEIPLGYLRKLVSEVRMKKCNKESWQPWYNRNGSGQLLRQAGTAVCILNEMIFGVSDQSNNSFARMFQKSQKKEKLIQQIDEGFSDEPDCEDGDISLYFLRDTSMLHQVIIEGIGIINICLGEDYSSCGFLHSSLYLLLELLTSSNYNVRSASDAVLHILAATSGYPTVGHLVLANADYVIDSICRQLRHLDLNPHVPNVLAAMLSYIGVANKILPLLEEPMRSVSLELEILGRHQHPELTIPFLKAVSEISKASKREANLLPEQAESYFMYVNSIANTEVKEAAEPRSAVGHDNHDIDMPDMETEQWENVLFKLNDSRRYRRTVGSIAGSCITAATPLLASANQATCLVAMDIVEEGVMALAKVEEAYRHERHTKESIEEVIQSLSLYQLQDTLDAADEGADENRLLPAMNKIWPFLVVGVQNKNPMVVRRCLSVVSNVVKICGGDFFSRRFYTDGSHFWKLLSSSPFHRNPNLKKERKPLQLPYRSISTSSEDSMAETSNLKVQVAVLNMIADLARSKRSASALHVVLKKVSGLVVGIACSGIVGLRDASVNALCGLASIDPDLVWLLLADVCYSMKKKDIPTPPNPSLPEIYQILPPPLSPKEYLYVQYGGQTYGFDVDFSSVETVFKKLYSLVFTHQMYS
ncbi:Coatomer beta subunit [Trema orientale]|uniref:Coatomer beta subunit n=1 Tax=Trema orientale TaxID=63057 RepID=A0A2P5EYV6_TREOI|nr:Coatomer beta subunit [Trema orientale]